MKSNIPTQLILQKNSSIPLYQGGLYLYDVILTFPAQNMENTMTIFNNFGSIQSTISITYPQQIILSNVDFSQITFQDNSEYNYYIYATIKIKKYESKEEWEKAKENADMSINPIPYTSTPKFAFGSIQLSSNAVYPNQAYYIPITITNNQGVATGINFQVLLSFTPSQLSSYINPNCQNIAFYDSHGNQLQSWIENATQSTTSGQVNIWVNLGSNNINPNSSITIYMAIANSTSVNYLSASGPAGAQPNYTSTYGEYDNGANVFSFYQNFAGTSLPSGWSYSTPTNLYGSPSGRAYLTVNNGVTLSAPSYGGDSNYFGYLATSLNMSAPVIIDLFLAGGSDRKNTHFQFGSYSSTSSSATFNCTGGLNDENDGAGLHYGINTSGGGTDNPNTFSSISNALLSLNFSSTSSEVLYSNYTEEVSASLSVSSSNITALGVSYDSGMGGNSFSFYWIRVRPYPPNGVMPSVTFGNVQSITNNITIAIEPVVSGNIYFDFVIQNTSSSAQIFAITNQNTNTTIINETIPANSVVEIEAYDYNQPLNQVIYYTSNAIPSYTLTFYTAICRETF